MFSWFRYFGLVLFVPYNLVVFPLVTLYFVLWALVLLFMSMKRLVSVFFKKKRNLDYVFLLSVHQYDDAEKRREMAKNSLERYTHYYERWATNQSVCFLFLAHQRIIFRETFELFFVYWVLVISSSKEYFLYYFLICNVIFLDGIRAVELKEKKNIKTKTG